MAELSCQGCKEVFLARDTEEDTKAAMLIQGWGWYDGPGVKRLFCPDCRHIPKPRFDRLDPMGSGELF